METGVQFLPKQETSFEDLTIIELHVGNKWSIIASHLWKQTSNGIMNYWNTNVKKRFIRMDIHSITHKSKANTFEAYGGHQSKDVIRINHMMGECSI
ncbi:hypothetical protein AAZX31_12G202300 [Glycine max]|uniref:Myb-like domain-containing protein n=1 Tax=Glycine max TaxID=3847 RepID=A0A0R0HIA5_SOYBN|nr:hypothetical protein GLYMA_12G213800v4 [Glycine max]